MKKIFLILLASMALYACSSDDVAPTVNYEQFKWEKAVRSRINYTPTSYTTSSDTTNYTYDGTTINYVTRQSTGVTYRHKFTLNDGVYTGETYNSEDVLSPVKNYYKLNAAGYVDTNWIINNSVTTQTSTYTYNTDGTRAAEVSDFSSYKNANRYVYQNGVIAYSINERISNSPSIAPALDSVVYEYYTELPFRVDYYTMGLPVSVLGKPAKYLLKKTTYYNKLNNKAIRQTTEYSYQTDAIGLITRRSFNVYTQPGNTLMLTENTAYTYYDK